MSGIFVKSIVPDSPAALNQRLRVGDRILAVNGISLVGMDYHRYCIVVVVDTGAVMSKFEF